MNEEIARKITTVSALPWQEMVDASQDLYKSMHETPPYRGVTLVRDQRYGSDERHRLDVFRPDELGGPLPVLVYVHGGGFVRGDKTLEGSPYYDNVGVWAVRNGFVGVTITYRLAPHGKFPSGGEDVGAAIRWVREHIAAYGGDPDGIILMGQSAGAAHVATYVARPDLHAAPDAGVAGIVLMSGVYEPAKMEPAPNTIAYLGEGPDAAAAANAIPGFVRTKLPVLLGISEFDTPPFHRQALALFDALAARDGLVPNLCYLPRHNHITQVTHLNAAGTGDVLLSTRLGDFIRTYATRTLAAH